MRSIDRQVEKVAHETRKRIEEWVGIYTNGDRYHINPYNLRGACAHASYVIYHVLKTLGYSVTIVVGVYKKSDEGQHFWVVVNDSHIVDVTATQFGISTKVCLIPYDQIENKELYTPYKKGRQALIEYSYWGTFSPQGKTYKSERQLRAMRREIINNLSQSQHA